MAKKKDGFTLVEMLVVAPVVILAIGAFITLIVSMAGEVLSSRASNVLAYSVQDAINRIDEDVRISTSFLAKNSFSLQNGQGIDDGTADFRNVSEENGTVLILNTYVTDGNPVSEGTGIVYLANKPNSCSSQDVYRNTPLTMNIVYFVKDSSLWRRTVMPDIYDDGPSAVCGTPWQQPSCTPGYDAGAKPFCKTNDVKLIEGVSANGFSVQYFNSASSSVADNVASNPEVSSSNRSIAMLPITTVGISILAEQRVAGRNVDRGASIRTTRPESSASAILPEITNSAPSVPTGVRSSLKSPSVVTVSWHQSNATKYTLQYSTASNFSGATTINDITANSHDITGLSAPSIYYFRVRAVNDLGTSSWSGSTNSYSTITDGLVGWWPMNNSPNSVIPGIPSSAVGGPTSVTGQNGSANGAYQINAANRGILADNSNNQSIRYTMTIMGWVYPTAYPSERSALVVTWNASEYSAFMSLANTGALNSYWYATSPEGYHSSASGDIPLNQWTHVAAQWTGSQVRLFVNGVQKGVVSVSGAGRENRTIYIGYEPSGSRIYNGRMDDFRLYNRALSPAEISAIYQDGAR